MTRYCQADYVPMDVIYATIQSALEYAVSYGWRVFPVHAIDSQGRCTCGDSKCASSAKHPLTKNSVKDATLDADIINKWWGKWLGANVAIATGNGLVVVDLDDDEAINRLDELAKPHGGLPVCPTVQTARGRHLYFKADRPIGNKAKLQKLKIDIRSDGGYVVAPPSIHASGSTYAWVTHPKEVQLPLLPQCLLEFIEPSKPSTPAPSKNIDSDDRVLQRAAKYLDKMPAAISGSGGHNATFVAAVAMVHGFGLGESVALELLKSNYNPRCQPAWSDKELAHKVSEAKNQPHEKQYLWLLNCKPNMSSPKSTIKASESAPVDDAQHKNDRPIITITTDEFAVNDAAADALGNDPDLLQRGGLIVRVVETLIDNVAIRRPGGPRIEPLLPANLRESMTRVVEFVQLRQTKDGVTESPCHPPPWCVNAVHGRSYWPRLRTLDAVIDYPVLTPNGSILNTNGYDESTGLYLSWSDSIDPIANNPTAKDINAAVDFIGDVICDFPFESDVHRAAFFAAVLTPLSRFAFHGPAPLFLIDANVRGSGKTLLTDIIGRIITGRPMVVSTFTDNADEMRKRITSHAIAGDRLVLLDNLAGFIRSPVLDACLTSETWRDRLLGFNKIVDVPLVATWYASGNNCQLYSDTARRTCLIRLESGEEHPERRDSFRHPDLLKYVSANRRKLLSAALTLLRGYCSAGKPDQQLPAWGSYSGWSDLVRNCVVWSKLPDPGDTRITIADNDPTAEALGLLMVAWLQADPNRHGLTAGEFIELVRPSKPPKSGEPQKSAPGWVPDAKAALDVLVDRLDPRTLGNRLRVYRKRVIGGLCFNHAGEHQRSIRWAVYPSEQFFSGSDKTHETHKTHTSDPTAGESGESYPGQSEFSTNGYVDPDLAPDDAALLAMMEGTRQ